MEQSEEWRPVVGWEGYYEVSNLGRVRRVQTGHILKDRKAHNRERRVVTLACRGRLDIAGLSRLVASAFIGEPPEQNMRVWTKDGDPLNVRPENLEWVKVWPAFVSDETRQKALEHLRKPDARAKISARLKARYKDPKEYTRLMQALDKAKDVTRKKVICIETGVIYPDTVIAAKEFGIRPGAVQASCLQPNLQSKRQIVKGQAVFHFKYYNPEEWKPKERIWKPVELVNGKYEVSNLGEVRHAERKVLRRAQMINGVAMIGLSVKGGTYVRQSIARLVAYAFLPRVYDASAVCHKDGDPTNNCVTNLQWVSSSELCNNPIAKDNYNRNRVRRAVVCVETGVVYASIREAAEMHHVTSSTIKGSCDRTKRGNKFMITEIEGKPVYHFRYADQ